MYPPITTPCIISPYQPNSDGYAQVYVTTASGHRVSVKQHRLVYAEAHSLSLQDMKQLVVMHKCDVRNCINPEHLMLGTVTLNNLDKQQKGRNVPFPIGNKYAKLGSGNTRLTAEQVLEIRQRSKEPQVLLAKEFKVTQAAISLILMRKTWKHI